jgi:hypothetical protein
VILSLSDYASVFLFIWRFVWGVYERAHIIRYFPPLQTSRSDWGIGADGDHAEYDVPRCAPPPGIRTA